MLTAPTVKAFFNLFVGAGKPAEIWTFPNLHSAVVVDLFAAGYLTKNVSRKYDQAKICARVFLNFFANSLICSGLLGFFERYGMRKRGIGESSSARMEGLERVSSVEC
jgi:hypothetical protein